MDLPSCQDTKDEKVVPQSFSAKLESDLCKRVAEAPIKTVLLYSNVRRAQRFKCNTETKIVSSTKNSTQSLVRAGSQLIYHTAPSEFAVTQNLQYINFCNRTSMSSGGCISRSFLRDTQTEWHLSGSKLKFQLKYFLSHK